MLLVASFSKITSGRGGLDTLFSFRAQSATTNNHLRELSDLSDNKIWFEIFDFWSILNERAGLQ